MQLSQLLLCKPVGCLWHLVYINRSPIEKRNCSASQKGTFMSKTASGGLVPSSTLFGRLLIASSRIAIRNGDLPYFGL